MAPADAVSIKTARKVLHLVDKGLTCGFGDPVPGQMCVEAAVCYAMGLPHGDNPKCVSASVRRFNIELNDLRWSSNKARARGLRRVAIAQLGSNGVVNDAEFLCLMAEGTIRKIIPPMLIEVAKCCPEQHVALLAAACKCRREGTRDSALAASFVAATIVAFPGTFAACAEDAAVYAIGATRKVASTALYYSGDLLHAVGYIVTATAAAAEAIIYATQAVGSNDIVTSSAEHAAIGHKCDAIRDRYFRTAADIAVDALRQLKSPGVRLMDRLFDHTPGRSQP